MPYTIWRQCKCGRRYFHRNNIPDPGQCEVCDEEKREAGE